MAMTTKMVAQMLIARLREARRPVHQRHYMSRFAANHEAYQYDNHIEEDGGNKKNEEEGSTNVNWVPHPRTGIYFPEGQEWVMNDVPDKSASLGQSQTYWLRNIHGVENHHPDILSADHYFLTSDDDA